jgi:hypothetical protein
MKMRNFFAGNGWIKIHCGQNPRHAELVSASIVQQRSAVAEKWTLKQVQGYVFLNIGCTKKELKRENLELSSEHYLADYGRRIF